MLYEVITTAFMIETATDNPTRTVANVRSYFNKNGGSLGTTGCVDYMFEHKCSFKVHLKEGVDLEELELELIEAGVQEIFEEDGFMMIYGDFEGFGPIQKYLEDNEFQIEKADFELV